MQLYVTRDFRYHFGDGSIRSRPATCTSCDFNLDTGLHHCERSRHISDLADPPAAGTPIPVGDHCYAGTIGSGFT